MTQLDGTKIRYAVQIKRYGEWLDMDTYCEDGRGKRHQSTTRELADAKKFIQVYNRACAKSGILPADLRIVKQTTTFELVETA